MSGRSMSVLAVLVPFGVLTVVALADVGYVGLFAAQLRSWGGVQVLLDLVILGALACLWMIGDARRTGLSPWPFVAITLVAGSFGPLLYLLARERGASSARTVPA